MQQRVGLARALAINPDILLMDEPFASVDAQTREVLQEELLQLHDRERKTMIFITHSIDEAIVLGDRVAVMTSRPGRVKEILPIDFKRPRDPAVVRSHAHYTELRNYIWNELRPTVVRRSMSVTQAESTAQPGSPSAIDSEVSAEQRAARERAKAQRRKWMAANIAIRIVSLIVVLGGWEYFGRQTNPILFTYPTAVASAAVKMIASGELWKYLSQSLIVLFAGLALAVVSSASRWDVVMARFWVIDVALDTYITALYSIPSVALVPVLVLWFGFEITAKIAVVFLFTFFPIVINTYQGVKNVDATASSKSAEPSAAARDNFGSTLSCPRRCPTSSTGLRLAIGRGLIGMVLADLYTAITGIGYLISRYASTYRTDAMFVPIAALGLLGITLTSLLRFIESASRPGCIDPIKSN